MPSPRRPSRLRTLTAYARKRGIRLVRAGAWGGYWVPSHRLIVVGKRYGEETATFIALHELGHSLVERGGKHDAVAAASRPRSWVGRVNTIAEEIAAWEAGERLARRLGVRINLKAYRAAAAGYVASYVVGAVAGDALRSKRPVRP